MGAFQNIAFEHSRPGLKGSARTHAVRRLASSRMRHETVLAAASKQRREHVWVDVMRPRHSTRLQASTTIDLSDSVPTPLKELSPHPIAKVLHELWRMTRPLTIPAEVGLALGGSLLAAKTLTCLSQPLVWLVAFFSAVTGAGSMVINDYFDHRAGVDHLKPKPLTVGTVHPEQVGHSSNTMNLHSSAPDPPSSNHPTPTHENSGLKFPRSRSRSSVWRGFSGGGKRRGGLGVGE